MYAGFSFWIWSTLVTQVLVAVFNSRSLISSLRSGAIEKQMSISFPLIYIFGALVNWYFLKQGMSREMWHGLLLIQMVIYGLIFVWQIRFKTLPIIIVTGLVFLLAAGTYFIGTS